LVQGTRSANRSFPQRRAQIRSGANEAKFTCTVNVRAERLQSRRRELEIPPDLGTCLRALLLRPIATIEAQKSSGCCFPVGKDVCRVLAIFLPSSVPHAGSRKFAHSRS